MYKDILKGKKAILFDLDGTIVDTKELWWKAIAKIAEEQGLNTNLIRPYFSFGIPLDQQWTRLLNNSFRKPKDNLSIKDFVTKTNEEYIKIIDSPDTKIPEIYGFFSFIKEIKLEKKLKTGLVTNTNKIICDKVLNKTQMAQFFDTVVTADDVKRIKPDPEMLLKAMANLGVTSTEVTLFEDSVNGSMAASNAKIEVVIIWDGDNFQTDYYSKILYFFQNYNDITGNMDYDWRDLALKKYGALFTKEEIDEMTNPKIQK